jgi:hypothetical protein
MVESAWLIKIIVVVNCAGVLIWLTNALVPMKRRTKNILTMSRD